MLTSIDVNSDSAFSLPILGITPKDSLLVQQITGLDPPDITLFVGDYARDGGIYQGRRVGPRNVVITMQLNPNPALGESVSSLREKLYKAFIDPLIEADYLKLGLHLDDSRLLYVVGYTEKIETEIFSADTLAQISIICPDPYIRDDAPIILTHAGGWVTVPFTYTGTAETGFQVDIEITADTPKLTLANNTVTDDPANPDYAKGRMIFTRAFHDGDLITINTVRGYRRSTLTPVGGGDPISIIANQGTSPWLELHSQANTMKIYGTTPADLVAVVNTLTYDQAYWGI